MAGLSLTSLAKTGSGPTESFLFTVFVPRYRYASDQDKETDEQMRAAVVAIDEAGQHAVADWAEIEFGDSYSPEVLSSDGESNTGKRCSECMDARTRGAGDDLCLTCTSQSKICKRCLARIPA